MLEVNTALFAILTPKWKVEDVYTLCISNQHIMVCWFPQDIFSMSSDVLHFSRKKGWAFQLSQPEPPVKCCYEKLQTCAGPPGLAFEIKARSEMKEQLVVKNPTFKTHMTFHYTDWLMGILIMVYYNHIYNWVVTSPIYPKRTVALKQWEKYPPPTKKHEKNLPSSKLKLLGKPLTHTHKPTRGVPCWAFIQPGVPQVVIATWASWWLNHPTEHMRKSNWIISTHVRGNKKIKTTNTSSRDLDSSICNETKSVYDYVYVFSIHMRW